MYKHTYTHIQKVKKASKYLLNVSKKDNNSWILNNHVLILLFKSTYNVIFGTIDLLITGTDSEKPQGRGSLPDSITSSEHAAGLEMLSSFFVFCFNQAFLTFFVEMQAKILKLVLSCKSWTTQSNPNPNLIHCDFGSFQPLQRISSKSSSSYPASKQTNRHLYGWNPYLWIQGTHKCTTSSNIYTLFFNRGVYPAVLPKGIGAKSNGKCRIHQTVSNVTIILFSL